MLIFLNRVNSSCIEISGDVTERDSAKVHLFLGFLQVGSITSDPIIARFPRILSSGLRRTSVEYTEAPLRYCRVRRGLSIQLRN